MSDKVVVLLPCYNESKTIRKVVEDFRQVLPDAEIYVFDNNSSDGSAEIARGAGAAVLSVKQQGKGYVVRKMFQMIDADVYLLVDSDDTYPAEDAVKLIAAVREGIDMACGDRLSSTYFTENKRRGHNLGNCLVRWLINFIWNAEVKDVMTGYRAFSRRFVKTCPILSNGFEIETEITIHTLDKRMLMSEIPIAYRDRPAGSVSKLNTVSDGMRVLKTLFNLFRHYRPLVFFGFISILSAAIGCVMSAPVFVDYFRTGVVPRFPTLIFSCFLFSAAVFFFGIGLILDALKKRSDEAFELELMKK